MLPAPSWTPHRASSPGTQGGQEPEPGLADCTPAVPGSAEALAAPQSRGGVGKGPVGTAQGAADRGVQTNSVPQTASRSEIVGPLRSEAPVGSAEPHPLPHPQLPGLQLPDLIRMQELTNTWTGRWKVPLSHHHWCAWGKLAVGESSCSCSLRARVNFVFYLHLGSSFGHVFPNSLFLKKTINSK